MAACVAGLAWRACLVRACTKKLNVVYLLVLVVVHIAYCTFGNEKIIEIGTYACRRNPRVPAARVINLFFYNQQYITALEGLAFYFSNI